jgi:hypothetical protein
VLTPPAPEPAKRFPAHYLWAVLIARIYEAFPLVCPIRAGQMRLIAFITDTERLDQTAFLGGGLRKPDVPPEKRRFSYWVWGRSLG